MTVGVGLLLIAIGAILRFAVTAHVSGVDLRTVGDILMVVGVIGFVVAVVWLIASRRRRPRVDPGAPYAQPPHPQAPPAAAGPYVTRVEERRYEDPPR